MGEGLPLGFALAGEGVGHIRERVTGTGGSQYRRCIRAFRAAEVVQVGAPE